MTDTNRTVARMFARIADALELLGEDGYRALAYRKAARTIEQTADDLRQLEREGRLGDLPGIGTALRSKIAEYMATGRMAKLDELTARLPQGLFELLQVPGLGPKTVRLIWQQLGVTDQTGLRRAIEDGSFARLPGMGQKKATRILASLQTETTTERRMYLPEAFELARSVIDWMKELTGTIELAFAGSLRRGCETIGDIDILISGPSAQKAIRHFCAHPRVSRVIAAGPTKASVLIQAQHLRQVDLRVVQPGNYGAALQYFTGSKEHNVALRALAQQHGLKLSEYGLFQGRRKIAGRTESDIYERLGLAWIDPELRENRGEIAAAAEHRLPRLVRRTDIQGDLHIHSNRSDGTAALPEIAEAARRLGYRYLAIADHSQSAHYAGGLSTDGLLRHCDEVDRYNNGSRDLTILKSCEVDIRPDGNLDYPDAVLARLDFVIASIHQGFRKEVTRRICAALAHPLVDVIAHPTGRLIDQREGYDVDVEKVIETAASFGKALEINAFYARLDLPDIWARRAAESGVLICINTDAHSTDEMNWMDYGVLVARRAWLEKKNVLNCLPLNQLLQWRRSRISR